MKKKLNLAGWLTAGLLASGAAQASPTAVAFSDNFDDGNVSDWVKTTNTSGVSAVTTRTDLFVSPNSALYIYFDAPPVGNNLWVHASHAFTASVAGSYFLSLAARSTPCLGCTEYYDIFLDGVSLAHTWQPSTWDSLNLGLGTLLSGEHTLTLGIFSTNAFSGRFHASFDDVLVTGPDSIPVASDVPEPTSLALLTLGLAGLASLRRRKAVYSKTNCEQ